MPKGIPGQVQTIAEKRAYYEKWKQANPDYYKKYRLAHRGPKKIKKIPIREQIFQLLGKKCPCGFDDIRALQIDHKNGGGKQHIESFKSRHEYYKYVRDNPDEFQILCANCNWIKRHEKNENRRK